MAVGIALGVIGLAEAGYGAYQSYDSQKQLDAMGDRPQYNVTPEQLESKSRSGIRSKFGFMPAQKASLEQGLSQSQNTAYRHAMDTSDGSMSRAIMAALNYSAFRGHNDIAYKDASLQDQHVKYDDSRGDIISRQKNLMTQGDQQTYDQLARAFGAEGQAGVKNIFSGMSTAAAGLGQNVDPNQIPVPPSDPTYGQTVTPMQGGRTAGTNQVTGVQDSYVPSTMQYRQTNNPQVDGGYNPDMYSFADSYYKTRSKNPPYTASPY